MGGLVLALSLTCSEPSKANVTPCKAEARNLGAVSKKSVSSTNTQLVLHVHAVCILEPNTSTAHASLLSTLDRVPTAVPFTHLRVDF